MHKIPTNARQADEPILRGWIALQHASRVPSATLYRLPSFGLRPEQVTLEVAYRLADRGSVDELYVTAGPDA
jgi:hypothetical protein